MYHSSCMIFEILYLKENITGSSKIYLDELENVFYELQDLLNTYSEDLQDYDFYKELSNLLLEYDFLFNSDDEEIEFNEEIDLETIYGELTEEIELTEIDLCIKDFIQNSRIYHALNLDTPIEYTKPIFDLNRNIIYMYQLLSNLEQNNMDTTYTRNILDQLEIKLENNLCNASESDILKIKMCIAEYNNMYLNDDVTKNYPWYILLLSNNDNLKKSLLYEKIAYTCELLQSYDEEDEEFEETEKEIFNITDEESLFFSYYCLCLNKIIEYMVDGTIKSNLINTKVMLLSLTDLNMLSTVYLETGFLDDEVKIVINKDTLNELSFSFLIPYFDEIINNIKIKDQNLNDDNLSFVITNILLLKCFLDLSINDELNYKLLKVLANSEFYKSNEYKTLTNMLDNIIFVDLDQNLMR